MKLDLLSYLSCCHLMTLFFLRLNRLSLPSLFSIHRENAYLELKIHYEEFQPDPNGAYLIIFVKLLAFSLLRYLFLNLILPFYFYEICQHSKNTTYLCLFNVMKLLMIKVHFIQQFHSLLLFMASKKMFLFILEFLIFTSDLYLRVSFLFPIFTFIIEGFQIQNIICFSYFYLDNLF